MMCMFTIKKLSGQPLHGQQQESLKCKVHVLPPTMLHSTTYDCHVPQPLYMSRLVFDACPQSVQ